MNVYIKKYMFLEVILTFLIFFGVKYVVFWLTDKKGLPEFLRYKPWICYKCCSFWSLITLYITIFVMFKCGLWYLLIAGVILTIFDAVALHIDENNVVSINEIEIK